MGIYKFPNNRIHDTQNHNPSIYQYDIGRQSLHFYAYHAMCDNSISQKVEFACLHFYLHTIAACLCSKSHCSNLKFNK